MWSRAVAEWKRLHAGWTLVVLQPGLKTTAEDRARYCANPDTALEAEHEQTQNIVAQSETAICASCTMQSRVTQRSLVVSGSTCQFHCASALREVRLFVCTFQLEKPANASMIEKLTTIVHFPASAQTTCAHSLSVNSHCVITDDCGDEMAHACEAQFFASNVGAVHEPMLVDG